MNECYRKYYLLNGVVTKNTCFELPQEFDYCIYEVIRIIDTVPLFCDDHLQRLFNSVKNKDGAVALNMHEIKAQIFKLIQSNSGYDGNIKIALYKTQGSVQILMYYIQHSYPSTDMYVTGVKLVSQQAERPNPEIKMVHTTLKAESNRLLLNPEIYETLLINKNGLVTEGSRSNIFFIKGPEIYTAPEHLVLKGITRQYVIKAINLLGLRFTESLIEYKELSGFESAFLTGTSPKVLAINAIDKIKFNVSNSLITSIYDKYNSIIEQYIEDNKNNFLFFHGTGS